jgi:hypothetical protein
MLNDKRPMMNDQLPTSNPALQGASSFQFPTSSTARLLSTMLCEDTLTDVEGNLTIYRVFRRVLAKQFPAMMRRLDVVTTWLGTGVVQQRVVILMPDKSEILYDCTGSVSLDGEQQVPFVNRFQWLVWPTPGVYWLRVLADQQPIIEDIPMRVVSPSDADHTGVQA